MSIKLPQPSLHAALPNFAMYSIAALPSLFGREL
jgi:hypothetical protein